MTIVSNRGFTLIELMISLAVSAIIIGAVYQLFLNQKNAYMIQDQVTKMQQNLRAGILLMSKELRSAGYDPLGTGRFGFVSNFAAPNDILPQDIDYSADRNIIAFTIDRDGQGDFDANDNELIAYRLNTSQNALERYVWSDNAWGTVAANVDALDFVYLDENGNVTTNSANFRAVEITLLVRTGTQDRHYQNSHVYLNKQNQNICTSCVNDNYRRRLLSTTVRTRN